MFGYIRPYVPDLRVREHELYRGIYCGLCRSMGKYTGCASRLTLSYDFVFLAAIRMALENIHFTAIPRKCAAHPLTKRAVLDDNAALAYSAKAAALLTEAKVADDLADQHGAARLRARLLLPAAHGMCKRAFPRTVDDGGLGAAVQNALNDLHSLECAGCLSLDETADCFGRLLSAVFSHGLSGAAQKIAAQIGYSTGRFIYVLDAADDRVQDQTTGSYNPLNLAPIGAQALSTAVRMELAKLEAAVALIDFSGYAELDGLVENIIYAGMPREADRIFQKEHSNESNEFSERHGFSK